jgi:GH35 family endo-1,4-beta-xylanase
MKSENLRTTIWQAESSYRPPKTPSVHSLYENTSQPPPITELLERTIITEVRTFADCKKDDLIVVTGAGGFSDGPEPYLRNTPVHLAIGDDLVLKASEYAQKADPEAELYYNDYKYRKR